MKVVHLTQYNGSGMNAVAESTAQAERQLGIDAVLLNVFEEKEWAHALDGDVYVAHTWFPETYKGKSFRRQLTKPLKTVFVGHGTPEHVIYESHVLSKMGSYGHGDPFMLYCYWLAKADARVTFWPRHQAILQTMVDTGTIVDCLPLGVDTAFWKNGVSQGKYAGAPSLWTGENPHQIKWPGDIILTWPLVYPHLDGATLHLNYLPQDHHRVFAPLIARTGAGYGMHWSALKWNHESLRGIFKSIDYFIGLVKYGDHNRLCLEANMAGAKSISYAGNVYSDYWLPEGDQRVIAAELVRILKGEVKPRVKSPVPDFLETAQGMERIYKRILARSDAPKRSAAKPKKKARR